MKNTLYLHIGIHKTGTTLLQKHIFPKSHKILYLGRYIDDNKLNNEYLKIFFNLSLVKLNFFQVRKLKKIQHDILVSNENILRPFSFDDNVLVNNLDILNNIFNLKILITTREVKKLILSRFLHNQQQTIELVKTQNLKLSLGERNCFAPFCTSGEILGTKNGKVLLNKVLFFLNITPSFRKYKCVCGKIKNINPKIYFKNYIEKKLSKYEILFFEIISNDNNINKSELLRLTKLLKMDPVENILQKTNKKKVIISEEEKNNFEKTIISSLKELNLN